MKSSITFLLILVLGINCIKAYGQDFYEDYDKIYSAYHGINSMDITYAIQTFAFKNSESSTDLLARDTIDFRIRPEERLEQSKGNISYTNNEYTLIISSESKNILLINPILTEQKLVPDQPKIRAMKKEVDSISVAQDGQIRSYTLYLNSTSGVSMSIGFNSDTYQLTYIQYNGIRQGISPSTSSLVNVRIEVLKYKEVSDSQPIGFDPKKVLRIQPNNAKLTPQYNSYELSDLRN